MNVIMVTEDDGTVSIFGPITGKSPDSRATEIAELITKECVFPVEVRILPIKPWRQFFYDDRWIDG